MILLGKKTIELRTWNTKFRGEFLIHSPLKTRKADCIRLKIDKKFVTGAIIGKAELYDVKQYESARQLNAEKKLHFAAFPFKNNLFGYQIRNAKAYRVPIPYKGQLGFFNAELPKVKTTHDDLVTDIIDEECRYQWIGRH